MDPVPSQSGAALDKAAIADLTHLLRRGRPTEAAEQLDELTARTLGDVSSDHGEPTTGPADPHRAMLDAVVAEPHVREALQTLEEWLAGTVDAAAALPLATSWALPAADLDLETVTGEVRLYIEAYPLEARVLGGLPERASTWLVARLAQTVTPAERVPAVRRAIASLVGAAAPQFPDSGASLRAVVDDVDDETLWYQLALGIVQSEISGGAAPQA
jgi:hypothetical protein